MKNEDGFLGPEDYAEPRCLLCGEPYGSADVKPIPQLRIRDKVDELMSRRDYKGVERHLNYWLEEARLGKDARGEFFVLGELVGHYRKTGEREKALAACGRELSLIGRLGYEGTVSAATAYVNVATAKGAFGDHRAAKELFLKAKEIYEGKEDIDPELLGGLYNNMGLTSAALGEYADAREYYRLAVETMRRSVDGALEEAMTLLNLANTAEAEKGAERAESEIFDLLDRARALFDADRPRDGYYAFVCEKCAPTFEYYGYFADAKELSRRAEEIYERT